MIPALLLAIQAIFQPVFRDLATPQSSPAMRNVGNRVHIAEFRLRNCEPPQNVDFRLEASFDGSSWTNLLRVTDIEGPAPLARVMALGAWPYIRLRVVSIPAPCRIDADYAATSGSVAGISFDPSVRARPRLLYQNMNTANASLYRAGETMVLYVYGPVGGRIIESGTRTVPGQPPEQIEVDLGEIPDKGVSRIDRPAESMQPGTYNTGISIRFEAGEVHVGMQHYTVSHSS